MAFHWEYRKTNSPDNKEPRVKKKRRKKGNSRKPDVHLCFMPQSVEDHAAAVASCAIDAAEDRRWFQEHPRDNVRERTCSPREIIAFGCRAGAKVRIIRRPDGSQLRVILGPDPRRN